MIYTSSTYRETFPLEILSVQVTRTGWPRWPGSSPSCSTFCPAATTSSCSRPGSNPPARWDTRSFTDSYLARTSSNIGGLCVHLWDFQHTRFYSTRTATYLIPGENVWQHWGHCVHLCDLQGMRYWMDSYLVRTSSNIGGHCVHLRDIQGVCKILQYFYLGKRLATMRWLCTLVRAQEWKILHKHLPAENESQYRGSLCTFVG